MSANIASRSADATSSARTIFPRRCIRSFSSQSAQFKIGRPSIKARAERFAVVPAYQEEAGDVGAAARPGYRQQWVRSVEAQHEIIDGQTGEATQTVIKQVRKHIRIVAGNQRQ